MNEFRKKHVRQSEKIVDRLIDRSAVQELLESYQILSLSVPSVGVFVLD